MAGFTNQSSYEISIVIPTYNRSNLLELTLRSLLRQVCDFNFEVIVSDDGSTDNTKEVTCNFATALNLKYVFYPDHGYHVTRARNLGLRLAEGKVVVFLDCGNVVSTEFVKAHREAHQDFPGSAFIGYIYGFQHTDANQMEVLSTLDTEDADASINRMKLVPSLCDVRESLYEILHDDLQDSDVPWALFWGGNISVATDAAVRVGGFDEWYKAWGADDIDFGLALHHAGTKIRLARRAAAIQYPHKKDMKARMGGYRSNQEYLHSKYRLEETEFLIGRSTSALVTDWAERRLSR